MKNKKLVNRNIDFIAKKYDIGFEYNFLIKIIIMTNLKFLALLCFAFAKFM